MALPVGVLDPHYSLISAPPGVPLTAITTSPNGAWVPNTPHGGLDKPWQGRGGTVWPVGTYDYQTTFSLAGLIQRPRNYPETHSTALITRRAFTSME